MFSRLKVRFSLFRCCLNLSLWLLKILQCRIVCSMLRFALQSGHARFLVIWNLAVPKIILVRSCVFELLFVKLFILIFFEKSGTILLPSVPVRDSSQYFCRDGVEYFSSILDLSSLIV